MPGSLLISIVAVCAMALLVLWARRREARVLRKVAETARQQRATLDETIVALAAARDSATEEKQRAESASRAKSLFLANMSHELRTPLNAIIGYAQMIEEDAADMTHSEIVADVRKISGAGKHLLGLINDVLDFSKIEAGKMELVLETIDLPTLLHAVHDAVAPVVTHNENQFVLDIDADIGRMTGDASKVRQILINLLSNAGKFTTKGTVTLRASRTMRLGADWVALSVADTGAGLTREQFGRLFQAFSQADVTTQRDHGGTGLGLALCRRFTLVMGGDIEVESKAGQGSTFTVMLPAAGPPSDARESATGDAVDDAEPISFHTQLFQIPTATGLGGTQIVS